MRVAAVLLLAVGASGASPIGRVVELLSNLKAKIVADGKAEQALYDKYACWCDETSARKASAIEEGKASVESLSQNILELNAAQGTSGATIKKLEKDIVANKESAKEAEALRAKEHAAYIAAKGELEANIDALEKAINVLAKGTTGFTPAMVATQSLTIVAGVRNALKMYEKDPDNKDKDLSPVKSFVANPAAWVQTKSSYVGNVKSYDHQSGAIQGILQEMYDSFQRDMGTSKQEEEQKLADFEALKQTKKTELNLLQTSLTKQSTKNGEDAKSLQDDKVAREEAEAQLRADEDFFFTLKQGCKTKAAEWADRSRVRTEELKGIAEAVAILSGGSEVFERADATLLQLAAAKKVRGPRDWAFTALKKAAKASGVKSIQLAALATKVYLADKGHFDAVIGEVDAMIAVLRSEEKDDVEHRDYCQTERGNAAAKTEALQYDMEELDNKVARLENKVGEVNAEKAKVEADQATLKKAMEEALAQRNEENTAFRQAMQDDLESISLIREAIKALAPKYGSGQAALVAVKGAKDAPADSPPETWGGSYEGRKSEGGGVIAILNMIAEDLEKDTTLAKKDEAEALAAYEKLRSENNASNQAMDDKKSQLEQQIADLNEEIAVTTGAKLQKSTLGNETADYVADLAKSCDWILAQFETRASQRKDEMNGLQNAKSILLGAGYDETKDQPTAKLVAVKQAQSTEESSYAASVDSQLRDLDSDTFGWRSFLQRRR